MGIRNTVDALDNFKRTHDLAEKLLTPKDRFIYYTKDFPEDVEFLYPFLKKALEENPELEVWAPLCYFTYIGTGTSKRQGLTKTPYAYISTKGNIWHLRKPTKTSDGNTSTNGYQVSSFRTVDGQVGFAIHRAVACTFIPLTEEQKAIGYENLHVNHKSTDKQDNGVLNLEWMTHSENAQHGVDNQTRVYTRGLDHYASKPLLGECAIPGEYEGYKFLIAGKAALDKLTDANGQSCLRAANGELSQAKGCKWKYATEEDIEEYKDYLIPEEMQQLIFKFNSNWKEPIVATRLSDNHTILIEGGPKELTELGFTHQTVYAVISGRKNEHKGYTFRRVKMDDKDLKEVKALIATQTTEHVKPEAFKLMIILGINEETGEMCVFKGAKDILAAGWDKSTVYRAVKAGRAVKGWKFTKAQSQAEVDVFESEMESNKQDL